MLHVSVRGESAIPSLVNRLGLRDYGQLDTGELSDLSRLLKVPRRAVEASAIRVRFAESCGGFALDIGDAREQVIGLAVVVPNYRPMLPASLSRTGRYPQAVGGS